MKNITVVAYYPDGSSKVYVGSLAATIFALSCKILAMLALSRERDASSASD